jgi:tRNA(Ile)-lysidine synthetase-like protein
MEQILPFWFPNLAYQDFWFSSQQDNYIKSNFYDIWQETINTDISDLIQIVRENNADVCLTYIILLDQFSRNFQRLKLIDEEQLILIDTKCMNLMEHIDISQYLPNQMIFMLLPYRHRGFDQDLDLVVQYINILERDYREDRIYFSIIRKFKNATIFQLANSSKNIMNNESITEYFHNQILDQSILTEFTSLNNLVLENSTVYQDILEFIRVNNITDVCVSLSGGVDSMVIAKCLYFLKLNMIVDINITAVHIDYASRPETFQESFFVYDWCRQHSIPLILERVDFNMNHVIDRDVFDIASKKIRFKLYHLAGVACVAGVASAGNKYILLGHHNDDFIENILSNLMKSSILHIANKMPAILLTDNLNISRPLINVPKSDIYAFAHYFNVPYLKDTTDVNCNRGMLRNTLLPLLQELYLNLQNRTDNNILLTNVGEIMIYNLLTEQTILNLFNQLWSY